MLGRYRLLFSSASNGRPKSTSSRWPLLSTSTQLPPICLLPRCMHTRMTFPVCCRTTIIQFRTVYVLPPRCLGKVHCHPHCAGCGSPPPRLQRRSRGPVDGGRGAPKAPCPCAVRPLSLIHISEPTRRTPIS